MRRGQVFTRSFAHSGQASARQSLVTAPVEACRQGIDVSESTSLKGKSAREERPELSWEERILRDQITQAQKLRWIGAAQLEERTERAQPLPSLAALFAANFKPATRSDDH